MAKTIATPSFARAIHRRQHRFLLRMYVAFRGGKIIAEARLKGKRFGRPLTAAKRAGQIRKLYRAGVSKAEIARRLEIGRTSVRRILSEKQP